MSISEEDIVNQCAKVLAAAGEAEDQNKPIEGLLQDATAILRPLGYFPIGALFNSLLRLRDKWGELRVMRFCMSLMKAIAHNEADVFSITRLDCSYLSFVTDGVEQWVADGLKSLQNLQHAQFLMCQGLTATRFSPILKVVADLPHFESAVVGQKLYDAVAAELQSPRLIAKLQLKKISANTSVLKDTARPLSEMLAGHLMQGDNEEAESKGKTEGTIVSTFRHQTEGDTAWAERVFNIAKIPINFLFFPKGRRTIANYIDKLKCGGDRTSRVLAEEIEQARRFLQRDPSIAAREDMKGHQRKRDRDQDGGGGDDEVDDENDPESMNGCIRILKRFGLKVDLVYRDIISVQGHMDALRRKGKTAEANLLEQAVEYIQREGGSKVSFRECEKEMREERANRAALDRPHENVAWAIAELAEHGFTEADVFSADDGKDVQVMVDRLSSRLITAKAGERLKKAMEVLRTSRGVTLQAASPLGPASVVTVSEMDQWARSVLRARFQVNDVESLIVAREEDIDEELETLTSDVADQARCALRTLQQIRFGRGIAEDVVERYKQFRHLRQ